MSARCIPFSDYASVRPARVAAVQAFGVTERQARFLTHVLVFSGVFLERQYCQFAGIVHGQKSHEFVAGLIQRGFVTPIAPGSVRRGGLYHVHFKPLYEAIGEPDNRHRKPATLGRLIARLMVLDAVLADDRYYWLGTERDKVHYFDTALESPPRKETYPLVTYGAGRDAVRRFFPHKLPIGVEKDGFRRHVFLYLVTDALPWQFRQFLLDHAQTLMACPQWTLRLLMPRRLTTAKAVYRAAFLDPCTRPVEPYFATWLAGYFAECQQTGRHLSAPEDPYLAKAFRHSGVTRVRALYRAWQRQGPLDGAVALSARCRGPARRPAGVSRPAAPISAVRRPDRPAAGGATGGQVRNASGCPLTCGRHRQRTLSASRSAVTGQRWNPSGRAWVTASARSVGRRCVPPVRLTTVLRPVRQPWRERPPCRARGVAPGTLRGSFTPWLAVSRVAVWGRVFVQESGAAYVHSVYAPYRPPTIASSSLAPCSSPSMRVAALRPRRWRGLRAWTAPARATAGHLRDGRRGGCSAGSQIGIDHAPPLGVD